MSVSSRFYNSLPQIKLHFLNYNRTPFVYALHRDTVEVYDEGFRFSFITIVSLQFSVVLVQ